MGDDTLVIVCSDHGFTSFRWSIHLNTWLVQEGFMAMNQGQTAGRELFQDVDWTKTSAFALGLNNVKGRERQGAVAPDMLPQLKEELVGKL